MVPVPLMGSHRHGQGSIKCPSSPPGNLWSVFVLSKVSLDAVFMHYFQNISSASSFPTTFNLPTPGKQSLERPSPVVLLKSLLLIFDCGLDWIPQLTQMSSRQCVYWNVFVEITFREISVKSGFGLQKLVRDILHFLPWNRLGPNYRHLLTADADNLRTWKENYLRLRIIRGCKPCRRG